MDRGPIEEKTGNNEKKDGVPLKVGPAYLNLIIGPSTFVA